MRNVGCRTLLCSSLVSSKCLSRFTLHKLRLLFLRFAIGSWLSALLLPPSAPCPTGYQPSAHLPQPSAISHRLHTLFPSRALINSPFIIEHSTFGNVLSTQTPELKTQNLPNKEAA